MVNLVSSIPALIVPPGFDFRTENLRVAHYVEATRHLVGSGVSFATDSRLTFEFPREGAAFIVRLTHPNDRKFIVRSTEDRLFPKLADGDWEISKVEFLLMLIGSYWMPGYTMAKLGMPMYSEGKDDHRAQVMDLTSLGKMASLFSLFTYFSPKLEAQERLSREVTAWDHPFFDGRATLVPDAAGSGCDPKLQTSQHGLSVVFWEKKNGEEIPQLAAIGQTRRSIRSYFDGYLGRLWNFLHRPPSETAAFHPAPLLQTVMEGITRMEEAFEISRNADRADRPILYKFILKTMESMAPYFLWPQQRNLQFSDNLPYFSEEFIGKRLIPYRNLKIHYLKALDFFERGEPLPGEGRGEGERKKAMADGLEELSLVFRHFSSSLWDRLGTGFAANLCQAQLFASLALHMGADTMSHCERWRNNADGSPTDVCEEMVGRNWLGLGVQHNDIRHDVGRNIAGAKTQNLLRADALLEKIEHVIEAPDADEFARRLNSFLDYYWPVDEGS